MDAHGLLGLQPASLLLMDAGGPVLLAVFAIFALVAVLGLAVAVIVAEAVALWWVLRMRALIVIRDAVLMNLASFIVGVPLAYLVVGLAAGLQIGMVVAFILSVGIEGGVLLLLHRRGSYEPRQLWRAVLTANVVTYIPFFAIALIALLGSL